jgi:hypothetical protein
VRELVLEELLGTDKDRDDEDKDKDNGAEEKELVETRGVWSRSKSCASTFLPARDGVEGNAILSLALIVSTVFVLRSYV